MSNTFYSDVKGFLKNRMIPLIIITFIFLVPFLIKLIIGINFTNISNTIERLDIDVNIMSDASMEVKKNITVNLSSKSKGFHIIIPKADAIISDIKVSENGVNYIYNPNLNDINSLNFDKKIIHGAPGTFSMSKVKDDLLIEWGTKETSNNRTFEVSYSVANAVKIHSDITEINRNFVSELNPHKINDLSINYMIPTSNEIFIPDIDYKVWVHGPLKYDIGYLGNDIITIKSPKIQPYINLETRLALPLILFNQAPKELETDIIAMGDILSQEREHSNSFDGNKQKALYDLITNIITGVLVFATIIFIWRKYVREYDNNFQGDYYRELPADYGPAILGLLYNDRQVKSRDMVATILDLARRKFLFIEEIEIDNSFNQGFNIIKEQKINFLPFPEPSSLFNPKQAILCKYEAELLEFLRFEVGLNKKYIYLSDIQKYASNERTAFNKFWMNWTEYVELEARNYNLFFEDNKLVEYLFLVGILVALFGIYIIEYRFFSNLSIIIGMLIFFTPLTLRKRTTKGEEDLDKWKAFKKFLEDFSQLDKSGIPSLIIWEHYLVYAVSLGLATKVIRDLTIVFPNISEYGRDFGCNWSNYPTNDVKGLISNTFDLIEETFNLIVIIDNRTKFKIFFSLFFNLFFKAIFKK